MGRLPKWLGNTLESVFSQVNHSVAVAETVFIAEKLKLVTFIGNLSKVDFTPGQKLAFLIQNNEYRRYTPAAFDREQGTCQVLFYLHDKGPGSKWAENLQKGEEVKLSSPGDGIKYDKNSGLHFFFGDESALGLFNCLKKTVELNDKEYFGVLELSDENYLWPDKLHLLVESVPPSESDPAANAITWMENMHPACWNTWQKATFYLAGSGASIQNFKKYLQRKGVQSRQIRTTVYWSEGKSGL